MAKETLLPIVPLVCNFRTGSVLCKYNCYFFIFMENVSLNDSNDLLDNEWLWDDLILIEQYIRIFCKAVSFYWSINNHVRNATQIG
jgi:hypothetical protein